MANASDLLLKNVGQQGLFWKSSFRRQTWKNHNFLVVRALLVIPAATVSFLKVFSKYETQKLPQPPEISGFYKMGQWLFKLVLNSLL